MTDTVLAVFTYDGVYVRLVENAWLAKRYGEIQNLNLKELIARVLQLMELNLKSIAVKRRLGTYSIRG